MTGKNTAVFGIYPRDADIELGVKALKDAGFRYTDISVLYPENQGDRASAHLNGEAAGEGAAGGRVDPGHFGTALGAAAESSLFVGGVALVFGDAGSRHWADSSG